MKLPFVEIHPEHLDLLSRTGNAKRRHNLNSMAKRLFAPPFKGRLDVSAALSLRDKFLEDGAPSTFTELKKACSKLVSLGVIQFNPTSGISAHQREQRQRVFLTRQEHDHFVEVCRTQEPLVHPLALGLWMTGLCLSDVCTLEWQHVDLDDGIIFKKRDKMKTRGGKDCVIPLAEDGAYLTYLRQRKTFADTWDGIYPSVNGHHYVDQDLATYVLRGRTHQIYQAWNRAAKAAGLPDVKPHDFRSHTATVLVNAIGAIPASHVTGHKNLNILSKYYRPDKDVLAEKVRLVHKEIT